MTAPRKQRAIVIEDEDSDTPLSPVRASLINIMHSPAASNLGADQRIKPEAVKDSPKKPASAAKEPKATPAKTSAKPKATPKAKTPRDPTSTRKGGKWTPSEDEELLELIRLHGDGTSTCWSTMAELHSRATSANALKNRFKELPSRAIGEQWIDRRVRFRNMLQPLIINRFRARQRAWLQHWNGVVHRIRTKAVIALQCRWRIALARRRLAARCAAQRHRRAVIRATEQLRLPATRWLRRARARIASHRAAERRFRGLVAAWMCRLHRFARLIQQHERHRAQLMRRRRAAAVSRLAGAWRAVLGKRAAEARSARVTNPEYKTRLSAYMKHLQSVVDERRFDLSAECEGESVVCTSRLIKQMTGWGAGREGKWPALRELMQNTIDHLKLLGDDGILHSTLRIEHEVRPKAKPPDEGALRTGSDGGLHHVHDNAKGKKGSAAGKGKAVEEEPTTTHVIRFVCVRPVRDEVICAITVDDDELIIEQAYTFPLHPRALDTGVIDQSKQNSSAAGGFGDGFKTAAIAILAMGGEMDWRFEAEGQCISWTFEGELRRAVGVLSGGKVLNVRIRGGRLSTRCPGELTNASHRMIQRLRLPGVGKAFRGTVMRRLQVFWQLDRSLMLSPFGAAARCWSKIDHGKGQLVKSYSFLADATRLQPIVGAQQLAPHGGRPESGVYVRGIWVEASPIEGTVVSFDVHSRIDVSGRDRNSIDDEDKHFGIMNSEPAAGDLTPVVKCADTHAASSTDSRPSRSNPSRKQQFSAHATTTDSASTFSPLSWAPMPSRRQARGQVWKGKRPKTRRRQRKLLLRSVLTAGCFARPSG